MTSVRMKLELNTLLNVAEEDGAFTSTCPAFGLASQGDTEEQAIENIVEAVGIFLEHCAAQGTLPQILQESGITRKEDNQLPTDDIHDIPRVVPFWIANASSQAA